MSLTLPLMYFQTGADLSKITHHEVHYQDGFVQQAWLQPEIQLFVVCIARKKAPVARLKVEWPFLPVFRPAMERSWQKRWITLCASLMSCGHWQGKTKTYLSQPELEFLAKNRQQSKSF